MQFFTPYAKDNKNCTKFLRWHNTHSNAKLMESHKKTKVLAPMKVKRFDNKRFLLLFLFQYTLLQLE